MRPIINFSTYLKKSSVGLIRISFGRINKKILFFFFKKFFYKKIVPYLINYSCIYNLKNKIIDNGIILYFVKPKSYTGEDVVEIQCHGNVYILNNILKQIVFFLKFYKIRISKKGEFTKRSFLNKKINVFDLYIILNFINYKNIKFLNSNFFLKFNYKIYIKKIIKLIENIEIFYKNNMYFLKLKMIYIKKKFFFLIKPYLINNNLKLKDIIVIGLTNSGKSTFVNCLIKNYFSIISKIKGTTKDIIKKKFKLNLQLFNIFDTSGFNSTFDVNEYLNFVIIFKKINFSYIIIYILNDVYYDYFFFYSKKKLKKFQIFIKLYNKIDIYKKFSFLEFFVIKNNNKNINLNLSSKKKYCFNFFNNEIKRIFQKNYFNFNKIIFKFLKKSYKYINKIFFFLKKKKEILFNVYLKKLKNLLKIIINKNNKSINNKIFKSLCLGK